MTDSATSISINVNGDDIHIHHQYDRTFRLSRGLNKQHLKTCKQNNTNTFDELEKANEWNKQLKYHQKKWIVQQQVHHREQRTREENIILQIRDAPIHYL